MRPLLTLLGGPPESPTLLFQPRDFTFLDTTNSTWAFFDLSAAQAGHHLVETLNEWVLAPDASEEARISAAELIWTPWGT